MNSLNTLSYLPKSIVTGPHPMNHPIINVLFALNLMAVAQSALQAQQTPKRPLEIAINSFVDNIALVMAAYMALKRGSTRPMNASIF